MTTTGTPRRRASASVASRSGEGASIPGSRYGADAEAVDDAGGTADVVALRMREDDRGQRPNAEPSELTGHVRLRRAFVDEHCRTRRLDERGVALADVEERDAESGRSRPRRRRTKRARHRRRGQEKRDEARDDLAAPIPRHAADERDCADERRCDHDDGRRRDLRRRPARDDPRDEREPPRTPAGEPRERGRRARQHGLDVPPRRGTAR